MANFPFSPIVVGNLCYKCCEDCVFKTGDLDAQCCDSLSGGTKECYSPKACKKCESTPTPLNPNQKTVINICTDPNYPNTYENKRACCNGQCYDNCYKCVTIPPLQTEQLVPNYDPTTEGCCGGTKYPLNCRDCCYECKEETELQSTPNGSFVVYIKKTLIQNKCSDPNANGYDPNNPNCCYGSCWNPAREKCKTCSQLTTTPDTGQLRDRCPGSSDPNLSGCCDGICIDPRNNCKECYQPDPNDPFNQIYRDKPNCVCCGPSNNRECCVQGQECCASSQACYDRKCERCD